MKRTWLKRALCLGAAIGLGASITSISPAQAATYSSPDLKIVAMGSDTTQDMMGGIMPIFDGQQVTTTIGTGTIHTQNVNAFPAAPGLTVDGDAYCPEHFWTPVASPTYAPPPTQWEVPGGSSHGRDYLGAQESYPVGERGCVDIARSSSGPRGQSTTPFEKPTFEYYTFALDAQSWSSPSLKAPATLTRAQLQGIYNCTYTNWNEVGGSDGPIQRYLPTAGSGTTAFFRSAFGITTAMTSISTPSCPAFKETTNKTYPACPVAPCPVEENNGNMIEDVDIDKAIIPYSGALWAYQFANRVNPTIDKRNGIRMGGFTTAPPAGTPVKGNIEEWNPVGRKYRLNTSPGGVVNEQYEANSGFTYNQNTDFNGIRYVYNVLDNFGNLPGYQAAFQKVGFDNIAGGFKSPVCDNNNPLNTDGQTVQAVILSFGYAPLNSTTNQGGRNEALGTCRKIPLKP